MATVEAKVEHREWVEIEFTAEEMAEVFAREEDRYGYPILMFDPGKGIVVDESWGYDQGGRIYISSFQNGVIGWSETHGQYFWQCRGNTIPMGQFVGGIFTLTDNIRTRIEELGIVPTEKETGNG